MAKSLIDCVFGRLTVTAAAPNDPHGDARWQVTCSCNTVFEVAAKRLRNGSVISCGCHKKNLPTSSSSSPVIPTKTAALPSPDQPQSYEEFRVKHRGNIKPAMDEHVKRMLTFVDLRFEQRTPEAEAELKLALFIFAQAQIEPPFVYELENRTLYANYIYEARATLSHWHINPKDL